MIDLSIGSAHFKASLWLLGGAALALLLVLHFSAPGADLEHWLASGKVEHATVQGILARDALHRRQAALARQELHDSLTTILHIVQAQQEAGAALLAQAQTADQFRRAGEVLAKSSQLCSEGLVLCQQRGDSLAKADSAHTDSLRAALQGSDSTLAQGLTVARCRFLLVLPCVSRMQAAELGLAAGILGTLVLKH